ncbi:uncharacterized protein [Euwallacea fornicatus]|uniref:uncharacterized protein n=1 Tax=Euwallacea fornicatus TaxID=995702 RepID=UPI00338E67B8
MGRKGEETTVSERKIIVNLRRDGKSYSDIATIVKRSRYTVRNILKRFETGNDFLNKPRSGRPKKLSAREERKVVNKIKLNPRTSASEIASILRVENEKDVSSKTVRRTFHRAGYRARVARKKPYISKATKKKRLNFAKEYIAGTTNFGTTYYFQTSHNSTSFSPMVKCVYGESPTQNLNNKIYIRQSNMEVVVCWYGDVWLRVVLENLSLLIM